jgi:hypothetical protein
MNPRLANPKIIMAHVEGSGAADATFEDKLTLSRILPTFPKPPARSANERLPPLVVKENETC